MASVVAIILSCTSICSATAKMNTSSTAVATMMPRGASRGKQTLDLGDTPCVSRSLRLGTHKVSLWPKSSSGTRRTSDQSWCSSGPVTMWRTRKVSALQPQEQSTPSTSEKPPRRNEKAREKKAKEEGNKAEEKSEDDGDYDPGQWNAICVAGLKVYSHDPELQLELQQHPALDLKTNPKSM